VSPRLWLIQTAFLAGVPDQRRRGLRVRQGPRRRCDRLRPGRIQTAEDHYTRAIQLRPTYARAYVDRASAIFLGASPQRTGFASIAPPEALARATTDLKSAVALGLENASTLAELGFYTFAGGVQSADLNLINQSIDFTRRGLPVGPHGAGLSLQPGRCDGCGRAVRGG
jgi:hypothetical protein